MKQYCVFLFPEIGKKGKKWYTTIQSIYSLSLRRAVKFNLFIQIYLPHFLIISKSYMDKTKAVKLTCY